MSQSDTPRSSEADYYKHIRNQRDLFATHEIVPKYPDRRHSPRRIDNDLVFKALSDLVENYEREWSRKLFWICTHPGNDPVIVREEIDELEKELTSSPTLADYFDLYWSGLQKDPHWDFLRPWRELVAKQKEVNP